MGIGNHWHENNVKVGKGRTEAEELVHAFAREADITTEQGYEILADRCNHGVDKEKAAIFAAAVRAEYGSLDTFQLYCDSMEEPAAAPALKIA